MSIEEKIQCALNYVMRFGGATETKNDAANIYADNYEEYLAIWDAIK